MKKLHKKDVIGDIIIKIINCNVSGYEVESFYDNVIITFTLHEYLQKIYYYYDFFKKRNLCNDYSDFKYAFHI